MNDYDPNIDPETQEDADTYVNWCAENFMRLSTGERRTYRSAVRCAHWLFVVASAQLHLDDDYRVNPEALLEQLVKYQQLGRALERQREHFPVEQLIVLRASLDCWEPVGDWAEELLTAARCSVAALILIEIHPLIDLWELEGPDAWALLDVGAEALASINEANLDQLEFADYAIRPAEVTIAKFTWQRANNITRHMGMPPMSPN